MASDYKHPGMTLNDVLAVHHGKIADLERKAETLASMLRVVEDLLHGVRLDINAAHTAVCPDVVPGQLPLLFDDGTPIS